VRVVLRVKRARLGSLDYKEVEVSVVRRASQDHEVLLASVVPLASPADQVCLRIDCICNI